MSPRIRFVAFFWCASLLTLTGCNKALPDPASPAPAIQDAGSPPTEAEAKEFADQMTQAVQARDAAGIDQLIRLDDLAERMISDLGLSKSERLAFLKGMSNSLQQMGMGQRILQGIGADGSYKLLRIRAVDGRPRVLFRMINSKGGLNYHEYFLARHKDGMVATEDMYIYLTAEPLSQSMRQILIPLVATARSKGGSGKIDPEEVRTLETMRTMTQATRSGNFKSAVAAYRTLPKSRQEQKAILILYLLATSRLGADGEADYLATMERFRQLYPDDAAVDLVSIDYFFMKKRYEEARHSIDQLDKAVGGDPYLDVMRGNMWKDAGRFEEAREAFDNAIKQEPDLTGAYWARITLSLEEKKHGDTLKWLQAIVEQCRVRINDLKGVPAYAEFVNSPQHGDWLKWYAGHAKEGND